MKYLRRFPYAMVSVLFLVINALLFPLVIVFGWLKDTIVMFFSWNSNVIVGWLRWLRVKEGIENAN